MYMYNYIHCWAWFDLVYSNEGPVTPQLTMYMYMYIYHVHVHHTCTCIMYIACVHVHCTHKLMAETECLQVCLFFFKIIL